MVSTLGGFKVATMLSVAALSYSCTFSDLVVPNGLSSIVDSLWRVMTLTLPHVNERIGGRGERRLPKTYESNVIHHDFVQFGKQHARHKAILSSIVRHSHWCRMWRCNRTPKF